MSELGGSGGIVTRADDSRPAELREFPPHVAEHLEILKRSYLYLRSSLVVVVVAIFLAIAFTPDQFKPEGEGWILRSISHYYYTPARIIFTGALCAAAVALLAISGKGVQSYLLDFAALLAPLIAIIPTRTLTTELGEAANVGGCANGWAERFEDSPDCIPEDLLAYVAVGFSVWVSLALVGIVFTIIQGILRRRTSPVPRSYWVMLGFGILTVLLYLYWWFSPGSEFEHQNLQIYGHITAAGTFFLIIALVAALEARRQWKGPHNAKPAFFSRQAYAVIYTVAALTLAVDVIYAILLLFVLPDEWVGQQIFWIEVIGLTAFAFFWVFQTLEHWRDADGWISPKPIAFGGRKAV